MINQYFKQIKIIGGLVVFLAIASAFTGLYLQNKSLKEDKAALNEKVGGLEQSLAQSQQKVSELNKDLEAMLSQKAKDDKIIASNRKTIQKLTEETTKAKTQLTKVKNENKAIKDFLNMPVDYAIIGLFRKQTENHYYNESGLCHASESLSNGNTCPIYTTESIINYALDLEKALNSCNADKASLREWLKSIQERNLEVIANNESSILHNQLQTVSNNLRENPEHRRISERALLGMH